MYFRIGLIVTIKRYHLLIKSLKSALKLLLDIRRFSENEISLFAAGLLHT